MSEGDRKSGVSRRGFLEMGSAALAAAGALSAGEAAAQDSRPVATDGAGAGSQGARNPELDAQNADSVTPPSTDSGSVPTFKYPFSMAHKRVHSGGWSREVTVRELPVSTSIAGVNMRLTAGGVRELHWHTAGEWAFMLYGSARLAAIDGTGHSFVGDVNQGDLWYFPTGIPHSIQGLNPDGCEFLLVFDDGNFSEYATVALTDWMAHTPRDVTAKNFGVSQDLLAKMPKQELFIFQAAVPGALGADKQAAAGSLGASPHDFSFRTQEMQPTKVTKGGEVRIIDSSTFKASTTIAAAIVTVHPGRYPRTPLASERRRMAVLRQRAGANDSVRHRWTRSHDGLSGWRRWLRPKNAAALRREHRQYRSRVSGNVQERLLSGFGPFRMADAYPAGTGRSASQS